MNDDAELHGEERAIYAIIGIASVPVVIGFLASTDTAFDAGTTISLGAVVFAAIGLWRLLAHRARLPAARVVTKR